MAKRAITKAARSKRSAAKARGKKESAAQFPSYCSMPAPTERVLAPDLEPLRMELIVLNDKKWVNGTVLHYYFFDKSTDGKTVRLVDGTQEFRMWTTTKAEKDVVRAAFKLWEQVGIGVRFEEVSSRTEAEIRIGFMRGDGSWSFLGRDILDRGPNDRTMNFGWSLIEPASGIDTATHEIGHTLGFPHEHQNPKAGIVWDEEAVFAALAKPPNNWDRAKTHFNIIRKIDPDEIQGSSWDRNSVMHYPFKAGLIKEPVELRNGLQPAGGLSERDKQWVKSFYPPLDPQDLVEIKPFESMPLALEPSSQKDFVIRPTATRDYTVKTFGPSDVVMALFEDENGTPRYLTAKDDSGTDDNAEIRAKLLAGRKYILRVRTYYAPGDAAVMIW
jgi:hypothetical protein